MPLDTARRQKAGRRAGQAIARTSIAVHRKDAAPVKRETPASGGTAGTHIYFACPECDKRMRVRSGLAGKRGACPSCQARIVFPDGATDTGEPKAPHAPAKKPGFSGLRNAVLGATPESPLPAKPAPSASKPSRSPRASAEHLAVNASLPRQPAAQPVVKPAEQTEPAPNSEPPGESARVLVGTVLGLLVGIFAGFIIGKSFAPARDNPVAAVQEPVPSVPRETIDAAVLAPHEASNFETENLTPSITEKPPEPNLQLAAASRRIEESPVEHVLRNAPPVVTKAPEPAPIEKAPEKVGQQSEVERILPVEAKHKESSPTPEPASASEPAPVPEAEEPEAAPKHAIAPEKMEKVEAPAKVELELSVTAAPASEVPAPAIADPVEPIGSHKPVPAAVAAAHAAAAAAPEPQAAPQQPASEQAAAKSEPVKAVPGRPVFTCARDVHDFVDKRYQGDDGKYKLTLTLVNKRGEERASQMVRYRYERDHLSKVLLTYVSPADVRGTTTMTIEQKDADDIQRIYIPSMKKNRRIASSDKGRSWAGTDFTYEDLQEHEVDDWSYGELKTDIVDGHECYFYVTTPVTPDKSCYTRIENWVRKDILEPVRAKYWDEKGKYLKELNFRDLRKIQGIWSAMYWEMENVQEGHKTVFKVEKVIYNTELKEDMFTPRSMVDVPLDF